MANNIKTPDKPKVIKGGLKGEPLDPVQALKVDLIAIRRRLIGFLKQVDDILAKENWDKCGQ